MTREASYTMENTMEIDYEEKIPLMISVIAPSNLNAGYEFEAYVNDDKNRPFTCVVPPGGVQKGQTFMVPLPESEEHQDRIRAPTGRWKDGLCDCFAHGCFHPTVWLACSFTPLALAQVMQRMSLTWRGLPGDPNSTKNTFRTVVMIFVSYLAFGAVLRSMVPPGTSPEDVPLEIVIPLRIGQFFFLCWFLYSTIKTRQAVRKQYSIPGGDPCSDCCVSFWCGCCVVSQLSRHTGDYENRPATCCTATGHPTAVMTV